MRLRKLTLWQIANILYHPRDEFGFVRSADADERLTEEEMFRKRWQEWGLTEDKIDRKWSEYVELCGYRDSLEKRGTARDAIGRLVADYESTQMKRRQWGW